MTVANTGSTSSITHWMTLRGEIIIRFKHLVSEYHSSIKGKVVAVFDEGVLIERANEEIFVFWHAITTFEKVK